MTLREVAEMMCGSYGVTLSDIRGSRRTRAERSARAAYYFYAKRLTDKSWAQIARYVGRDDHTTPLKVARRFEAKRRGSAA